MAQLFSINVLEINGIPRAATSLAFPSAGILVLPYVGASTVCNSSVQTRDGFIYSVAETATAIKTLANA